MDKRLLFLPTTKSGLKSRENPKRTLWRLLDRAGIARMRIHDLRHTFASVGLNAGATDTDISGSATTGALTM
jgi:integrase